MLQRDSPQEQIQALRSVIRGVPPNSIPPASPDEIYYVETQLDPHTQKEFIFWDDIVQAFDNAVQVRQKARVIPFLRGKDHSILEPRRIAAIPDTVLDVVVDTPVTSNVGVASPQVRQLELQSVPPQDGSTTTVEAASQDAISTPSATSTPIFTTATSTPNATSSSSPPSTATSAVRRNPAYGLVEMAMENYTHIDRPLAFPSARGPHAALDDQPPTINNPTVPPHSDNNSSSQQRGPQSATANVSVELQWARTIIDASEGDKDAQVALGDMYKDGKGVAQDHQAAMDWYLKAADQGDAAGQQRVGSLYDEGFGVPQNHLIAMGWYLKAAQQGDPRSQFNVGRLYHNGQGVPKDYAQAMDWHLKAANQGDAFAQNSIGIYYNNGRGVPQDFAQAMDWFLKAANQGNEFAQFNIGVLYKRGQGTSQDYTKAAEWFSKAADRGHTGAKRQLDALKENGAAVN
ncbi:hypothetical protein EC957_001927 [Mortierella hygrophila]|uniref:HCP-like protein n=1 Tax=Mortierella hygrophila TaxID=979708 RepID=A0A9P6F5Y2_9FUNG|nr:hypothetical protein EC957_001927 [Mortierella hygrophila]